MNSYSRDQSIYGHHLLPLALLQPPPEDTMQHIKDLQRDLDFAESNSHPDAEAIVITTQETVRRTLAELATLRIASPAPQGVAEGPINANEAIAYWKDQWNKADEDRSHLRAELTRLTAANAALRTLLHEAEGALELARRELTNINSNGGTRCEVASFLSAILTKLRGVDPRSAGAGEAT